jgi:hypothetical protein
VVERGDFGEIPHFEALFVGACKPNERVAGQDRLLAACVRLSDSPFPNRFMA